VYWDKQKDIWMDDKENEHLGEYVFMVQIVPNNGTYMSHVTNVHVKVKLDEKHSVTSGNARIIISNLKTLTGIMTHQRV
jgi:hypothetical protein